ncbi:MAG: MFS transporter [Candidatus Ornithospirochaeta sp.]
MSKKEKIGTGALSFIFIMGIVSLFSDMTHEGARSVIGPFLSLTGASASTIGFVSGLGELCGYSLRLISGPLADKSGKYWTLVIIGYAIQVLAVPLLALVPENGWVVASSLIILERSAKALKKPAKNSLVSFAASEIGTGKGFAYMEVLDQVGAFIGPVIIFLMSFFAGDGNELDTYHKSFGILLVPALVTITLVIFAWRKYPHPEVFEKKSEISEEKLQIRLPFVLFLIAVSLFAFGFADFSLLSLHSAIKGFFPSSTISLLYALAMAVDAVAALVFGSLYDKIGLKSLVIATVFSSLFPFFAFLSKKGWMVIIGIILWGIGMGAEESIMKSAVASIVPKNMRSTGFGVFETVFGIAWFLGSWLLGVLYDGNIVLMAVVSFVSQILAIVLYLMTIKIEKKNR